MSDYTLPSLTAAEALSIKGAVWLDLRRPAIRHVHGVTVSGAVHADPIAFDHRHALVVEPRPIIVFCAHGHELSQFGCALLLVHKRDARYVVGGFDALQNAGAPLEPIS